MRAAIAALTSLFLVSLASPAAATVACTVVADADQLMVQLRSDAAETADAIRDIPVGDLVVYPQEPLAPKQVEGWVWVRHDAAQTVIWQTGEFGWLRILNIANCG